MSATQSPQHDPLGPSRHTHQVGRPMSPWKRHWLIYGKVWLAVGLAMLLLGLAFTLMWAFVSVSSYYSRTAVSSKTLPTSPVVAARQTDLALASPIRITLELRKLDLGNASIVARDVMSVIERRLAAVGVQTVRDSTAAETLVVEYRETKGRQVEVMLLVPGQKPERLDSFESVGVQFDLFLRSKRGADRPIARIRQGAPAAQTTIAPTERKKGLAFVRQHVYQATYTSALNDLGNLGLGLRSGTP